MILCAASDIHGALDRLYEDVLAFRKHDGAGDFPAWIGERRAAPRKTVFIKGNHEDFVWLDAQHGPEVLLGCSTCGMAAR